MAAAVSLVFAPVTPALVQFVPELASTGMWPGMDAAASVFGVAGVGFIHTGRVALLSPRVRTLSGVTQQP